MLTKVKVFNVLGNSSILTLFGVFSVTRVRANTSSEQHYIHIIRYAREGKNRKLFLHEKKEDFLHEKEDFLHEREDFPKKSFPKTLIAENFFVTLHSKQRSKQTQK